MYNADERENYFGMNSDRTSAECRLADRKMNKIRSKALACANFTGTDRFRLCIFGTARRPRCFKKSLGWEVRFNYRQNKKSKTTTAPLFEWLLLFDVHASKTPNRKVSLLRLCF